MKRIYGLVLCLGLMVLIGTAGASDLEIISSFRESAQVLAGLLMVLVGFFGGKIWTIQ